MEVSQNEMERAYFTVKLTTKKGPNGNIFMDCYIVKKENPYKQSKIQESNEVTVIQTKPRCVLEEPDKLLLDYVHEHSQSTYSYPHGGTSQNSDVESRPNDLGDVECKPVNLKGTDKIAQTIINNKAPSRSIPKVKTKKGNVSLDKPAVKSKKYKIKNKLNDDNALTSSEHSTSRRSADKQKKQRGNTKRNKPNKNSTSDKILSPSHSTINNKKDPNNTQNSLLDDYSGSSNSKYSDNSKSGNSKYSDNSKSGNSKYSDNSKSGNSKYSDNSKNEKNKSISAKNKSPQKGKPKRSKNPEKFIFRSSNQVKANKRKTDPQNIAPKRKESPASRISTTKPASNPKLSQSPTPYDASMISTPYSTPCQFPGYPSMIQPDRFRNQQHPFVYQTPFNGQLSTYQPPSSLIQPDLYRNALSQEQRLFVNQPPFNNQLSTYQPPSLIQPNLYRNALSQEQHPFVNKPSVDNQPSSSQPPPVTAKCDRCHKFPNRTGVSRCERCYEISGYRLKMGKYTGQRTWLKE